MHIVSQFAFFIGCFYMCICNSTGMSVAGISPLYKFPRLPELMITNGANVCKLSNETLKLDLLIVVDSVADHQEERQKMRSTWGSWWLKKLKKVRMVFFVGIPSGRDARHLYLENKKHADLVFTNFDDDIKFYGTVKSVAWLQWAANQCNNTKFLLTINDRTLVNVPKVMEFIKENKNSTNTIWGSLMKPIYNTTYVMFKKPLVPCTSHGYMMSFDVVKKLLYGALKPIHYIRRGNVYLTGLVAANENVKLVNNEQFKEMEVASAIYPLDPNDHSVTCTHARCNKVINQFIFITSKDKDEWLYLMSTFMTCVQLDKKLKNV